MMLVTILFGALAALFAALFFLQRANLRRACRELRQINQAEHCIPYGQEHH